MTATRDGPDAITDVPGIRAGHWTDRRAATGCTVVLCPPDGATGGVDVRGGAPGTRETDLLHPTVPGDRVHAVVLAGGSAFGLDAASGVMRYLEEQGIGVEFGGARIPIVPAAILFDLRTGSATARPTADSGYRAATAARSGRVQQGSVGAGTGATVAKAAGPDRGLKAGVGTASERGPDGLIAGALVAVNAGGDVIDPDSAKLIAGPRADKPGRFLQGWKHVREGTAPSPKPGEQTTLAVVATSASLTKAQASRLASVAHDGFARTIRPVHTTFDGDVVFALATGEIAVERSGHLLALDAMAVRAVERAVLRAVRHATGLAGVPSAREWLERC